MAKHKDVLKFVIRYKSEHNGNSPSYEEIMAGCKIKSKSHVSGILDELENDGLLEHNGVKSINIPNSVWELKEAQ